MSHQRCPDHLSMVLASLVDVSSRSERALLRKMTSMSGESSSVSTRKADSAYSAANAFHSTCAASEPAKP